ncbi:ABC transporter transmembrane region domain-containing protein [Ditylenchus destructor]|uniref:ABC transporter transmembrane region domain-containing protein n=1 Tax=Ditylenchus destructor TaxID=166010 RepID=A0AAD4N049_9BILA|nr:ABC transporter transmembrane region domain-containing protein [Ditylenchus destructor]
MKLQSIIPTSTSLARKLKKNENGNTYKSASFLQMLRYANTKDWLLLSVGVIASLLNGIGTPFSSVIYRGITDTLMEGQARHTNGTLEMSNFSAKILLHVWQYFFLGTITFILANVMMASFYTLCERQVHKIRRKLFEAILNQDIGWFDNNEVGTLTEKMSTGIERIKQGASDKIAIVLQAISTILATVIIAFTMSWRMTLVMLITVPLVVLSLFGSIRAISSSSRTQAVAYSSAGAVAEEVINGIRTVASFNGQFFEIERYEKFLRVGQKTGIKKAVTIALFQGFYLFIVFMTAAVAFWYGTTLVLDGHISPGTVFAMFIAILVGSIRVGQAFPQINVIIGAKLAAGEIFDIIDRTPEINPSDPSGMKLKNFKGQLELSNVHFSYPSRPNVKILNGMSFTVAPGQKVALVGSSGCGKSTIISLLMRYYKFNRGSVTIDDIPISALNIEWLRNTIGIRTIVVCGQKQRLSIARVLIREPKILLLDEATSALDTVSESLVQQALDKASIGRTTITIAHRLSTIRNSDKIIVLDQGTVVESGTHNGLMSQPEGMYRNFVMAQEILCDSQAEGATIFDDSDQIEKSASFSTEPLLESLLATARMARERDQIRYSFTSVKSISEFDEVMEKLDEDGAKPASVTDILHFSRPEWKLIVVGCALAVLRGASWPMFSVILGRIFMALSQTISQPNGTAAGEALRGSIGFAVLGVVSGLSTFGSGSLMGIVGEKMTMRLRLAVFKNILRQDGSYFDDARHSTGKLTSRLATDAPNVQAVSFPEL